jgi:ketosteroid isomerase-like protein
MRLFPVVLPVLVALLAPPAAAQEAAAAAGQDSAAIARLHERWIRAFQQHDPKLLESVLANEFVVYVPEPFTKQQLMENTKDSSVTRQSVSQDELRVRLLGSARDVAFVTGLVTQKGLRKGQPVMRRSRYTEVWVKRGGGWQCVAGQSSEIPAKGQS